MNFTHTKISDVILVEIPRLNDDRGYFIETYHYEKFLKGEIQENFIQDNQTYSKKHVLRGLHY